MNMKRSILGPLCPFWMLASLFLASSLLGMEMPGNFNDGEVEALRAAHAPHLLQSRALHSLLSDVLPQLEGKPSVIDGSRSIDELIAKIRSTEIPGKILEETKGFLDKVEVFAIDFALIILNSRGYEVWMSFQDDIPGLVNYLSMHAPEAESFQYFIQQLCVLKSIRSLLNGIWHLTPAYLQQMNVGSGAWTDMLNRRNLYHEMDILMRAGEVVSNSGIPLPRFRRELESLRLLTKVRNSVVHGEASSIALLHQIILDSEASESKLQHLHEETTAELCKALEILLERSTKPSEFSNLFAFNAEDEELTKIFPDRPAGGFDKKYGKVAKAIGMVAAAPDVTLEQATAEVDAILGSLSITTDGSSEMTKQEIERVRLEVREKWAGFVAHATKLEGKGLKRFTPAIKDIEQTAVNILTLKAREIGATIDIIPMRQDSVIREILANQKLHPYNPYNPCIENFKDLIARHGYILDRDFYLLININVGIPRIHSYVIDIFSVSEVYWRGRALLLMNLNEEQETMVKEKFIDVSEQLFRGRTAELASQLASIIEMFENTSKEYSPISFAVFQTLQQRYPDFWTYLWKVRCEWSHAQSDAVDLGKKSDLWFKAWNKNGGKFLQDVLKFFLKAQKNIIQQYYRQCVREGRTTDTLEEFCVKIRCVVSRTMDIGPYKLYRQDCGSLCLDQLESFAKRIFEIAGQRFDQQLQSEIFAFQEATALRREDACSVYGGLDDLKPQDLFSFDEYRKICDGTIGLRKVDER